MNEKEFNNQFASHLKSKMPASIKSFCDFIYKSHKLNPEEIDCETEINVISVASLLNIDCMAHFMGIELEDVKKEDLVNVTPSVTVDGKTLFYSIHLLHKTLVIRSATAPEVYNGYQEISLEDFGLTSQ